MSKIMMANLGDIADVNWGDTSVTKASYVEAGFPAYSAAGADGFLPYADFDRDAVILSAIGARCGKTWFATGKWSCIKNTIRFWSTNKDVDDRYLYWVTADESIWPKRGAAQPFITIGDARRLKIPVFPLSEQRRIAAILDQAEALRAKRRQALAKLDELGRSIFLEMFGDPAINPHKFPTKPLSALVRVGDTINYGVVQPGDDLEDGIPLVRVGDLIDGRVSHLSLKRISPSIEVAYKRSRLMGDEILVSCVGSIGVIATVEESQKGFNIARAVARIRLAEEVERAFVAEYLKTDYVQRYFIGELRTVSQPTLNIKQLAETRIFIPSIELQREFSNRSSVLERLKVSHRISLAKLDGFFVSLKNLAFKGDL